MWDFGSMVIQGKVSQSQSSYVIWHSKDGLFPAGQNFAVFLEVHHIEIILWQRCHVIKLFRLQMFPEIQFCVICCYRGLDR